MACAARPARCGGRTSAGRHRTPRDAGAARAGTRWVEDSESHWRSGVPIRRDEGSGQIRAKIYAKALRILLQRDRSKIRRVFHTELTCYPPPAQSVAPGARRAFL